jgi:hypothetical protein
MSRISAKARLVCIAVTAVALIAPMSAQTGVWTSPAVLSTGGQGWEAGEHAKLWGGLSSMDEMDNQAGS